MQASKLRIYDELHNWLVIGNSVNSVTKVIDDYAFGMSTDFVIAVPRAYNYSVKKLCN